MMKVQISLNHVISRPLTNFYTNNNIEAQIVQLNLSLHIENLWTLYDQYDVVIMLQKKIENDIKIFSPAKL